MKRLLIAILALCALSQAVASGARRFTVSDDIELTLFGTYAAPIQFSPNREYFGVDVERGRLDRDGPESMLRIYRTSEVIDSLKNSGVARQPEPVWSIVRATDFSGPIIREWRWLADSRAIAFLEREEGCSRLVLAELEGRTITPLTPSGRDARGFDIRDRSHFVYALSDPRPRPAVEDNPKAASTVATGRWLGALLFPGSLPFVERSTLWAAAGGQPFQVVDRRDGHPVVLYNAGSLNMALSPDGKMLVTQLAVDKVPASWVSLYPPPFPAFPYRVRAGRQDLTSLVGEKFVSRYVAIDLQAGTVRSPTDAPAGYGAGWFSPSPPVWSVDGRSVVLPNSFVAPVDGKAASRPCIAVADVGRNTASCVEALKAQTPQGPEEGYRFIEKVGFVGVENSRIFVNYHDGAGAKAVTEYARTASGAWAIAAQYPNTPPTEAFNVTIRQGLNDPPVLVATDMSANMSGVIWDPNPQLKEFDLGEEVVYRWKDRTGRDWKGGLYKPPHFEEGVRYPLVIQTHGFDERVFNPHGAFPTAFAARELAAAGILVLQLGSCGVKGTPEEGPCNVAGYEAAVTNLATDGLVDPGRVGIVGFSRTAGHVVHAITTPSLHLRAASITDGILWDYLQYMINLDQGWGVSEETEAMIGARPFGTGLDDWLKRSPQFQMDKVTAPLLVVGEGPFSLLYMYGPYAALRYQHKPVDLIMLNTTEHVLTNPVMRLASQGGTVDWFRFWLQDYEDPDPAKADQYARWRGLREQRDSGARPN